MVSADDTFNLLRSCRWSSSVKFVCRFGHFIYVLSTERLQAVLKDFPAKKTLSVKRQRTLALSFTDLSD